MHVARTTNLLYILRKSWLVKAQPISCRCISDADGFGILWQDTGVAVSPITVGMTEMLLLEKTLSRRVILFKGGAGNMSVQPLMPTTSVIRMRTQTRRC